VAAAKKSESPSFGQQVADAYTEVRAQSIRAARARVPTPSYQQIAVECGCSISTVYNVLTGRTHAPAP
jgi:hypothetical protein